MNVFWQYNPIYNEIQFSPFHMSEKNISLYIKELIRYRPEYLHGYPSAIDTIANYLIRNNMLSELPEIKAAFLVSEGCTEVQRNSIERAFRTRVFSSYGHSERLIFGGECEKNTTYHQFPDYGILEIINDNGEACEKEGERGEIVGTGLNNFCMPLIRYRTGDFATRMESNCDCGRCWDRFTKVEGRWKQDMVIGRTGAKISIAALNMHGPLFERIVRYQYYQDKVGSCVLKMMAAPGFTETDRKAIEVAYKNKVGNEVDFVVQIVQDIPLTGRGKLKLLDSRIINIKKNQNI
jgi:phenylacetate-CoA ligase